ncbi:hypothetical protein J6590_005030 [Homalodisca vitripennis]|nr:hypothetical protein J6590_005030 [Homalodisca vitripennis]
MVTMGAVSESKISTNNSHCQATTVMSTETLVSTSDAVTWLGNVLILVANASAVLHRTDGGDRKGTHKIVPLT